MGLTSWEEGEHWGLRDVCGGLDIVENVERRTPPHSQVFCCGLLGKGL